MRPALFEVDDDSVLAIMLLTKLRKQIFRCTFDYACQHLRNEDGLAFSLGAKHHSDVSLVDKVGSNYLLVNLVARRAREIAQKAEDNEEILDKKPVSIAIDEVYSGKLTLDKTDE